MTEGLWLAFVLPVTAAMLYFYFTIRAKVPHLIAKGGATWTALMTAVFCYVQGGCTPSGGIIIAAVALFVLADVLLDLKFIPGVAAFALGHIALIAWICAQGPVIRRISFVVPAVLTAAALFCLSVFLFRKTIFKAGRMAAAMLPYAAVLSLMTGFAALLPFTGGAGYLLFAAGAVLFMISDLMVAQGMLVSMARKWHILAMMIYESAVMLMALSA